MGESAEPRQEPRKAAPVAAAAGSDSAAARFLAGLGRRIAASLDLGETLQQVAQAVVDHLGYGAAVINLIRPHNMCEVVAAAGPPEASTALLGTRASMEVWHQILSECESWGQLRFLDHSRDQRIVRSIASWIPVGNPAAEAEAWHPLDILLAPLNSVDGTLIGVLSVDLPDDGRRPNAARREMLEQFAAYAALAIENSRVHTLLADSEQLFRATFDRSPIAIALLTADNVVARVNPAYQKLVGRASAELLGLPAGELVRSPQQRRLNDPDPAQEEEYEVHFTRPDDTDVWGRVHTTPLDSPGQHGPSLILAQIEDITMLRAAQSRLAHDASHDSLTGLANRAMVMRELTAALAQSEPEATQIAVLYCDVDHFKQINDTGGHAAGDLVLADIARALQHYIRITDTVGRLGGDEFVVIARPVHQEREATALAERVIGHVSQAVTSSAILPSLSIGVALSIPGDTADTLLAAADDALYHAKALGRHQWHFMQRG